MPKRNGHSPCVLQQASTIVCLMTVALIGASNWCCAQTIGNREPTFEERLIAGLQVRRPSEFAFINAVVDTVDRGELPQKLVDRFFFWARGKAPRVRGGHRPIVFFQPALTIQAEKLGIEIAADPTPDP